MNRHNHTPHGLPSTATTTSGKAPARQMAHEAGVEARSAGTLEEAPRGMIVGTATTASRVAVALSGSRSSCCSPRNRCTAIS